ncbi:MAG TPA: PLDc N-terminal domain-containing protein, partial [Pseudoxanthomonas sp.]|nr:PLDc N-terminal domain-containing protein [Pseudoxanthomonas sp.]
MPEPVQAAWNTLWSIPDLERYLFAAWLLYLVPLCAWIVLQKREPAATLSWVLSLATLPYFGYLIYYLFGPQKITRQRLRRRRSRAGTESFGTPGAADD